MRLYSWFYFTSNNHSSNYTCKVFISVLCFLLSPNSDPPFSEVLFQSFPNVFLSLSLLPLPPNHTHTCTRRRRHTHTHTHTIFIAGLGANFEYDLKKIIALSTLSQLGLIIRILSIGFPKLAYFHLLTHASHTHTHTHTRNTENLSRY